ncbi:MAG: DNA-processing protein DprA [Lentisphaerota bacterium]
MTAREAYIVLNMIDGLGPVKVRALVDALGSPEAVLYAGHADLLRAQGIGTELAATILEQAPRLDPCEEEGKAQRHGGRIITFIDPDYPAPLKKIHDPPLCLYIQGTLEPVDKHALAIVGTRHATHYGLAMADRLGYQMARVGFTVVSGLARGIDTAAHKGALKAGGRTLAVLGSALDQLYPPENEDLAQEISKKGAVISEYSMGRAPDRTTFPYRNRVVSGLAMGVVVVEAGVKSGALMTADQALEQGRSVFAVPGRTDSSASKGPHQLIKNGARLVEDIDDIMQEFEFLIPDEKKKKAESLDQRAEIPLTPDEQTVVRALWEGPMDVDSLVRKTGLKVSQVSSLLMGMEMKRVVHMLSGRMVELSRDLKLQGSGV